MKFVAGQRVRFTATFKDFFGVKFDPASVVVAVRAGQSLKTFTMGLGVEHDGLGVFHVEVLLDAVGSGEVRFSSKAHGEEGANVVRFTVEDGDGAQDAEAAVSVKTDEQDEVVANVRRSHAIAALDKRGVEFDRTRSTAYLEGLLRHVTDSNGSADSKQAWEKPLPSSRFKR